MNGGHGLPAKAQGAEGGSSRADTAVSDGAQTLFILDPFACQMELMTGNRLGVTCTNYLFRKSLWSRLSGFRTDVGVATDFDFLLRATDKPVAWCREALFWKRQHDANLWRGDSQGNLLVTTIRERWLRDTVSTFEAERHKANSPRMPRPDGRHGAGNVLGGPSR